jgi:hypothetical protein
MSTLPTYVDALNCSSEVRLVQCLLMNARRWPEVENADVAGPTMDMIEAKARYPDL